MTNKPKPGRELAARALCRHDGHAAETRFIAKVKHIIKPVG